MSSDELIEQWLYSAQVSMSVHYEAARMFERRHYWLGVPALILSTAVGTTVFATLKKDLELSAQLATGLASLSAGILTALQTFMGFSNRAEKHKAAGAEYASLVRLIHEQLAFPSGKPDELKKFISNLRTRFDTLSKESPSLRDRLIKTQLHIIDEQRN